MFLRATIKKASALKKVMTVLNNLFQSISMNISENNLNILMITTCDYMLFDINLLLDEVVYEKEERAFSFSVNAKHFLESFNTLKANDSIILNVGADQMIIETVSQTKRERSFLFVSKTQNMSVSPQPEYQYDIEVKNLNFPKLCKALSNAGRELIIKGNSRRIIMRANLEGMYGREVEFGTDDDGEEFEDVYFTEHFLDISKISNLSNTLIFRARKDYPLCIEARLDEKSTFKIFIKSKQEEE